MNHFQSIKELINTLVSLKGLLVEMFEKRKFQNNSNFNAMLYRIARVMNADVKLIKKGRFF